MIRVYAITAALGIAACPPEREPVGPAAPTPTPSGRAATAPAQRDAPILPESATPVTFAKMAKFPEPGWQIPRAASFSPDGTKVTYLMSEGDTEEMALFALDLATGQSSVLVRASSLDAAPAGTPSLTQELRDERQRKRIKGITDYAWADAANVLIVPTGSDVFLVKDGGATDITAAEGEVVDAKICGDGSKVALVRGGELSVIDVATKRETRLTKGAPKGVTRGVSDFNGQEEFDEPSGHFWSPDCSSIVYLEVDERDVAEEPVLGYRAGTARLMMQKYPRAGEKNPKVSIWVADAKTSRTVSIPLPSSVKQGAYFGRFRFTPNASKLVYWAVDRSQRKADLVVSTLGARPESHVAYSVEVKKGWVEMTDVAMDPSGEAAYILLEKEGHQHLASVKLSPSTKEAPVFYTQGAWDVLSIDSVSKERKSLFVVANRDHTIGRMLYEVTGPDKLELKTPDKGYHSVKVSRKGDAFIDVWSNLGTPPRAAVRAGDKTVSLPVAKDPDIEALALRSAETFQVKSESGETLYGALLPPRKVEPGRRYPLVLVVYGGPGVQTVLDRWSPRLLWQHLADRGFYVMQIDNRGSSGRGSAFAFPIDRRLGDIELVDQIAGLDYVMKNHPIDPGRVAIYGHSYGGFMAALAMLEKPDRFRAGVAASPVTDWRLYDTGYTERYMGTPKDNPAGYERADLSKRASKLEGELLIVHALMDENVHFLNTAGFVDALVREKKTFEMFVFPGERHGYRSPEARLYALQNVTRYLTRTLGMVDSSAE